MFSNLFKSKKAYEPLDYELRKYFENNILCLIDFFPESPLENRKVFLPTQDDIPINWNKSKEDAIEALKIVSEAMRIDPDEIELDFYSEGMTELSTGTFPLFLENDTEEDLTAGLYFDKNTDGKYVVAINETNFGNPDALIATLAHELCHIKLLGEKKMEENDEHMTDLATVFFGFGVFSSNASFQFSQEYDRWGYRSTGYLNYDEWAYSLALFAFLRYEENPAWSEFLNPTIKKEFHRCLQYMVNNEEEIFKFKESIT